MAANVPAKLRVRVINSGTGDETGGSVNDVLTSGIPDPTKYKLISVSSGTPNGSGGFDTTICDLPAGTTTTLLFTVASSADGKYCDTATVAADAGTTIGIGSDSACLTVATPKLTIKKTDAPGSVLPGSTYTSTIVVKNEGAAVARNVVISDLLGFNDAANVWTIYVSSSLNDEAARAARDIAAAWPEPAPAPLAVEVLDAFEGATRFAPEFDASSKMETAFVAKGSGLDGSAAARLEYHLGEPGPGRPFVWCALVSREPRNLTGREGLVFSIRADGVYRLWVQVRDANPASADDGTEWWFGSVRTSTEWTRVAVPFERLRSLNPASDGRLDLDMA